MQLLKYNVPRNSNMAPIDFLLFYRSTTVKNGILNLSKLPLEHLTPVRIDRYFNYFLKVNKDIHTVDLSSNDLSKIEFKQLLTMFKHINNSQHVKTLKLIDCSISKLHPENAYKLFQTLKQLTTLNLSCNYFFLSKSISPKAESSDPINLMTYIIKGLSGTKVENLFLGKALLEENHYDDKSESIRDLFQLFKQTNVKRIELNDNFIGYKLACAILSGLQHCPNVKSVNFNNNPISRISLKRLRYLVTKIKSTCLEEIIFGNIKNASQEKYGELLIAFNGTKIKKAGIFCWGGSKDEKQLKALIQYLPKTQLIDILGLEHIDSEKHGKALELIKALLAENKVNTKLAAPEKVEPGCCSICLEEVELESKDFVFMPKCENEMHKDCFEEYVKNQENENIKVIKCTFCRESLHDDELTFRDQNIQLKTIKPNNRISSFENHSSLYPEVINRSRILFLILDLPEMEDVIMILGGLE